MTTVSASTQRRSLRTALLLLGAAWIASEAISALSERLINGAVDATPAPMVAAFSGRFEAGVPVYRLPSLTVTAKRSVVALEPAAKKGAVDIRPAKDARARS